MKLHSLVALLAVLSVPAFAAFTGPSTATINTVQAALQAADDTPVQLTGYITQSLGNEIYMFQDKTGEMKVEIDHENWRGIQISAKDTITLYGEVVSDSAVKTIDVEMLYKN